MNSQNDNTHGEKPRNNNSQRRPQINNSDRNKENSSVLEQTAPIKIAELQPRNNNSSFTGKIMELEVINKGFNYNNKPRRFFKGLIGDETGTIKFDFAEKIDVSFKVNDIVTFEKAMNKVSKEGHHYVEIKRFGKYKILQNHPDITVNTSNNLSEAIIAPLPEGEEKPRHTNTQSTKPTYNHGQSQQTSSQHSHQAHQTKNVTSKPNNFGGKQQHQHPTGQRFQSLPRPTPIGMLQPGTSGQVVVGQVFEVSTYERTPGDPETIFMRGRVADETGNINFDFKLRGHPVLKVNDIVQFSNAMNKVNEEGYHYLTIGKFGFFSVMSNLHPNTDQSVNKSIIQYSERSSQ